MKNRVSGAAALLLVLLIGLGCALNNTNTTINGTVLNYGKPLSGVEVTFGPTGGKVTATTGPDGKFQVNARHRRTAMLYLTTTKKGYAQREKIEFPGFAAPSEPVTVEMLETVSY